MFKCYAQSSSQIKTNNGLFCFVRKEKGSKNDNKKRKEIKPWERDNARQMLIVCFNEMEERREGKGKERKTEKEIRDKKE